MINIMIDIESTGLDANNNAMIQLGAVAFDIEKREIGESFCECLSIPVDRHWDRETHQWWYDTNKEMLAKILDNGRKHTKVLEEFKEYVESFGEDVLFWSNHTIDWEFVNSYYKREHIENPFGYASFRDVSSYLEAFVPGNVKKYSPLADKKLEHDALYDCLLQIDWIFNTVDKTRGNKL